MKRRPPRPIYLSIYLCTVRHAVNTMAPAFPGLVAQRIRHLTADQKIPCSNPARVVFFVYRDGMLIQGNLILFATLQIILDKALILCTLEQLLCWKQLEGYDYFQSNYICQKRVYMGYIIEFWIIEIPLYKAIGFEIIHICMYVMQVLSQLGVARPPWVKPEVGLQAYTRICSAQLRNNYEYCCS